MSCILPQYRTHGLLNILAGSASGEERELAAGERFGGRNDLRAVYHRVLVLAKDGERGEDELEIGRELGGIVCMDISCCHLLST